MEEDEKDTQSRSVTVACAAPTAGGGIAREMPLLPPDDREGGARERSTGVVAADTGSLEGSQLL